MRQYRCANSDNTCLVGGLQSRPLQFRLGFLKSARRQQHHNVIVKLQKVHRLLKRNAAPEFYRRNLNVRRLLSENRLLATNARNLIPVHGFNQADVLPTTRRTLLTECGRSRTL